MGVAAWTGPALDAALRDPNCFERFSVLTGAALLPVDLRAPAELSPRARARLALLPCVTVGVGVRARGGVALEASGCAGELDLVLESESEFAALARGVARRPLASLALVQLLRRSAALSLEQAVLDESLVYATLQAGPEFAAFLRRKNRAAPEASQPARTAAAGAANQQPASPSDERDASPARAAAVGMTSRQPANPSGGREPSRAQTAAGATNQQPASPSDERNASPARAAAVGMTSRQPASPSGGREPSRAHTAAGAANQQPASPSDERDASPARAAAAGAALRQAAGSPSTPARVSTAAPAFWQAARASSERASPRAPVLRVQREGARLCLRLNRPERRNAVNAALRDALCEALSLALRDATLRRVELSGAGPSFCSGGDLDEFGTLPDPAHAHAIRSTRSAALLLAACEAPLVAAAHDGAQRPRARANARAEGEDALREAADTRVTARVHGACVGAGVELAAFCSRVRARADAFFALPELDMGLVPGAGGTASLPRRIGRQRTAWMALTCARVDAPTARAWGLVDEIEAAP